MPTLTKAFSSTRPPTASYIILLREAVLCGAVAIAISAISDYFYFSEWTFPPYQWLHFNISQDLAIFYGRNDFHYYVSQGLPLLLTTYLPFALISLYQSTSLPATDIRFLLTTTILVTLSTLSLISHKEVRFIYPILPLLHILTAPTISTFFQTRITTATNIAQQPPSSSSPSVAVTKPISTKETITKRKPLLYLILLLNLTIAGYTTLIHQRGVVSLLPFLRSEYESLALDIRGVELSDPASNTYGEVPKETNYDPNETFVGFLMPCHSTPWRSQLIYPGMKAWALGCEPPIHLKAGSKEREEYRDEADRFYDDPLGFLGREVNTQEKPWPRYIVGFEGIEKPLKEYYETEMKGFKVREKWRSHNSHWHDDSRRSGDVVVWEFADGSAETGKSS
jgi:phosphatidylinositol glycan class B